MLNLDNFPEFKSDIQGNATNIHPIVKINTNPPIYLSQNAEVLEDNGEIVNFQTLNLKIPSIKESIDIENRNFKINNVTLTLSNTDYFTNDGNRILFSDLFNEVNFLNTDVQIYWKSQSCTTLVQCLPIYRAIIKRVSHDYNNIKIILEDLTESVMHKKVPIGVLNSENAYKEEDINKTIPMVFGEIEKAPCVLYKDISLDLANLKKIYTLVDRFEIPVKQGTVNALDGYNVVSGNYSGFSDYLYVYSGTYLKVMKNLSIQSNLDEGVNTSSPQNPSIQIGRDFNASSLQSKTYLRATYDGLVPTNTISMGIMQVVYNNKPTSLSLGNVGASGIHFSGANESNYANIGINWQYEDEGFSITNPEYGIDGNSNTYANFPPYDSSNLTELATTDDGFFLMNHFYNGSYTSSSFNSSETFSLSAMQGDWDEENPEISDNEKYWHWHRNANRLLGSDLANKVEFICMPDAKKLYDLFSIWYENETDSSRPLRPWSSWATVGDYKSFNPFENQLQTVDPSNTNQFNRRANLFNHFWGTPTDFFQRPHGQYGNIITSGWRLQMTDFEDDEYLSDDYSQTYVPNYLYGFARDLSNVDFLDYNLSAFLTFSKDFNGDFINGYDLNGLPKTTDIDPDGNVLNDNPIEPDPIYIDFWELMEYHGFTYDDFPRYRITGLTNRHQYFNSTPYDISHFKDDLQVEWNGIDSNFWQNTGEVSGMNQTWDAYNGGASMGFVAGGYYDWYLTGNNDGGIKREAQGWHNYFCGSGWHMHFTESHQFENSGVTAPKGLMMPGAIGMPILKDLNSWNGQRTYMTEERNNRPGMRVVSKDKTPGIVMSEAGSNYFNMNLTGNTLTTFGLLTTLSSEVDDAIEGSGFSYLDAEIYFEKDNNIPIVDNLGNNSVKLIHFGVDLPEAGSDGSTEIIDLGNLSTASLSTIDGIDGLYPIYNTNEPLGIQNWSDQVNTDLEWDIPSRFNATMIGFIFNYTDREDSVNFRIEASRMSMKHVFEIDNIFDKNFYLETKGRMADNILEGSPPTSVIRHIIEEELGLQVSLDTERFNNIDSFLSGGNWSMAFSQTKQMEAKKLIQEIAKNSPVIPLFRSNSTLSMAIIKNDYTGEDVSATILSSDIIKSSFDRTKIENVKTMVSVKHTRDYETDSYEKTSYVSAYDFYGNGDKGYPSGYKKEYYGLDKNNAGDSVLEFESKYTRYPVGYTGEYFGTSTPEKLRDFTLAYNCNQHNIIKFRVPIKYANLEVTDIIRFDSLIENMKLYGEDYTQSFTRNGQEIYPYFMITNITKDIKYVNIECIQMHNLNRNDNVLSGASGDFNLTGATDQQDYEDLNQHLLYPNQYISEGQLYSCDMNGDKVIDSNDLAILNEVLNPDLISEEEEDVIVDAYNYEGAGVLRLPTGASSGVLNRLGLDWRAILRNDNQSCVLGVTKYWSNNFYEDITQALPNWTISSAAGEGNGFDNFETGIGRNIFLNNPDVFNYNDTVLSDNNNVMSKLTPNILNYYTGTGGGLESIYVGWHMKIGNEWIRVTDSTTMTYSNDTLGIILYVERGVLGTQTETHNSGDEVFIYSGEPSSGEI